MPRKDKERAVRLLADMLNVARDVAVALSTSHPVVMALAVMSGVTVASLMLKGEEAQRILSGLYADAKTLATVSAAAPYVVGSLNLVSQVLGRRMGA